MKTEFPPAGRKERPCQSSGLFGVKRLPCLSSGFFGTLARRGQKVASATKEELRNVHLARSTPPPGGPTERRPPKLFSRRNASARRDAHGVPTGRGISSPSLRPC
eukprot:2992226-Amphidinium_carterae.1